MTGVAWTFESAVQILTVWPFKWKLYWAVLSGSCGTVYYAVQGVFNFWVCGRNPSVTIHVKATEQYFPVVLFIMLYKVVLTFKPVDEILKSDHSNEGYWAVLSHVAIYFTVLLPCGNAGMISDES